MSNFLVASIDGIGERDDIALERDRQQNNRPPDGYTRWEDYHAAEAQKLNATSFGISSDAQPISSIVQAMVEAECWGKICLKSQVDLDMDICEALTETCIQLGVSDEEFAPNIIDQGNQIEINLY